jgi:hypothetical protein
VGEHSLWVETVGRRRTCIPPPAPAAGPTLNGGHTKLYLAQSLWEMHALRLFG